ncbi:MAG: hypothetical protein Kow0081_4320 [Candidatus Dojkabacteria bacterium]
MLLIGKFISLKKTQVLKKKYLLLSLLLHIRTYTLNSAQVEEIFDRYEIELNYLYKIKVKSIFVGQYFCNYPFSLLPRRILRNACQTISSTALIKSTSFTLQVARSLASKLLSRIHVFQVEDHEKLVTLLHQLFKS